MIRSLVAFLALSLSLAVFGQEFRGTISGAVTDPAGASIGDVKLTATEVHTGTRVQTVSNSTGVYTLPFLAPGLYTITAQIPGFKEFVRTDVNVAAGSHSTIDIRLDIGNMAESVQVSADVPQINTENGSAAQTITARQVEDMPLNGRTPLMLAQLAIGVVATGTPTLVHPFDLSAPAAFSVAGTPSQYSEILLDGVPDETWDGRAAYNPPQDAVEEVSVKAFDTDASFGHTGGGTMNQILKNGTNGLHGSLWEFNQPSDMVANDFFRNRSGQGLQISHFNQFGVSVGGPLVLPKFNGRSKLFWFFSYEGLKDGQPAPAFQTVPTDAEKRGDFSALLAAGSQYKIYDPASGVLSDSGRFMVCRSSPATPGPILSTRRPTIALRRRRTARVRTWIMQAATSISVIA